MGPVAKMPSLPFFRYNLEARLRAKLKELADPALAAVVEKITVEIRHDGVSRMRGEAVEPGPVQGRSDAAVVIIGTGLGVGILEGGNVFEGTGLTEGTAADDPVRGLGMLGRHLVYVPDTERPSGYKYEYRGIAFGKDAAVLNAAAGEVPARERISGPALARRTAVSLKALLTGNAGAAANPTWGPKTRGSSPNGMKSF
jgi:hypothetical protein